MSTVVEGESAPSGYSRVDSVALARCSQLVCESIGSSFWDAGYIPRLASDVIRRASRSPYRLELFTRGECPDRLFVHLSSPPWPVREYELSILDHRNMRHQLVLPGHAVDFNLH